MSIRNRVRELRHVRAAELRPHPKNWRTHPSFQQRALRAVLDEVGFADALLARELPDGSLQLIDGHLRAELLPDELLPVLVLNVDEREADLLLATLDPLSALADSHRDTIAELCRQVDTDSAELRSLFDRLSTGASLADSQLATNQAAPNQSVASPTTSDQAAGGEAAVGRGEAPLSAAESYQLAVECRDEDDQRLLYERLTGEGRRCRVLTL